MRRRQPPLLVPGPVAVTVEATGTVPSSGGGGLGGLDEAPSPDEYAATRVAVYNADDSGVVYALEGGHEADVTGSGTAADEPLAFLIDVRDETTGRAVSAESEVTSE